MRDGYQVFDADAHVVYPPDLWSRFLDKPYRVTEPLLSPGERADLLVQATQRSGTYKWLSLPYSRGGMSGRQQVTLMTLAYSGAKRSHVLPRTVDPDARRVSLDVESLPRKQIRLQMGHGGVGINGITYVDHEHCYMTHSSVGTWEVWEVINESGMDHPFHHHTNSAQVRSISGGDAGYASLYTTTPAWKDVTVVPPMGRVELLMPVLQPAEPVWASQAIGLIDDLQAAADLVGVLAAKAEDALARAGRR